MKDFTSQFKASAHAITGAILSAFTLYASVPAIHDAVNKAAAGNSRIVGFIASASAIVLAYANFKKKTE
jgi:hypothetical protein